jgi:hypothetical protein
MEESLIRQTVNICFRNMDECNCLAARLGMCMHNIPESLKERLQIKADKTFGGRVSVLRSGMTDELAQRLEYFSGLLAPPQQTYVHCSVCMLVMRSTSADHMPKHTCHKTSATKTGTRTSFKYRLPFRTDTGEIITVDANILPVRWTHIYLLDDWATKAEEKIHAIGIESNVVQIMAQDPMFHEI